MLAVVVALLISGCAKSHRDGSDPRRDEFASAQDPPFNIQTRFAAALLAESQGAYAQAIEQYQSILEVDPKHLQALHRIGLLQAQLGQHQRSIRTWERYVAAAGQDPAGYGNLGFSHELAGNFAQAEAAYLMGIATDPLNEACRVNYGLMLARLQRVEEARTQFEAVLPPSHAHYNIGSVHEQEGRHAEAIKEYRQALLIDPRFHPARQRLETLQSSARE